MLVKIENPVWAIPISGLEKIYKDYDVLGMFMPVVSNKIKFKRYEIRKTKKSTEK